MTCPYGCKFDATICMMRHTSAIKRMDNPELYDGDERDDYCMCYDCNAVKCFIKYRSRMFENNEKYLKEEQKQFQRIHIQYVINMAGQLLHLENVVIMRKIIILKMKLL